MIAIALASEIALRFDELEKVVKGTWLQNRLYVRMSEADPQFLAKLNARDGIAFAYACVKCGEPVSTQLARELYLRYAADDRIGLLIWCFGHLRQWDLLVDIASDALHGPPATQSPSTGAGET